MQANQWITSASILAMGALVASPLNAAEPSFVYCKEDIARLCPGVAPGGGRILGCLKQHENEVSIGCAKELKAIKAKMGK